MNIPLLPRVLMAAVLLLPTTLMAQMRFTEGRHYVAVKTPATTGVAPAGKIEVAEVFSYVCGGCNGVHKMVDEVKKKLPADAAFVFVHAGFNTGWPTFQRAHLTAQQLGIADRNHSKLFEAIWDTGSFPFFDRTTNRPRVPAPVIADLAKFYAQGGGVTEADFSKRAASSTVDAAVKRSDELIKGWEVPATPTFVVAGRYRIINDAIATTDDLQALITHLVSLERSRSAKPAAAK